jgi:hypothetical protein
LALHLSRTEANNDDDPVNSRRGEHAELPLQYRTPADAEQALRKIRRQRQQPAALTRTENDPLQTPSLN